jgi:hypothetical protein
VQIAPDKATKTKNKEKKTTVNGAASYCTLQDLNLGATTVVEKTPNACLFPMYPFNCSEAQNYALVTIIFAYINW